MCKLSLRILLSEKSDAKIIIFPDKMPFFILFLQKEHFSIKMGSKGLEFSS